MEFYLIVKNKISNTIQILNIISSIKMYLAYILFNRKIMFSNIIIDIIS